jgi:hypothetical protein
MLSGEQLVTPSRLEEITTARYREQEHHHLATIASEQRAQALDLAEELREDPAIREFMKRVTWTTRYDVVRQDESSASVVARVILTERRPGDRKAALAIPNLPKPLGYVLRRGLELPFNFSLKKEDGLWRIDELTLPEVLVPLVEKARDKEEPQPEPEATL